MKKIAVAILGLALGTFGAARAEAACGTFEVAKGDIKVQSAGKVVPVSTGGKICAGDTVIAGADSRAKIKMADGNELNVSPDSKIVIEDYQYDKSDNKKKVLLNILKGKVRATTREENMYNDKAKDGQANTFQIRTKSAVAGVRGTDFLTGYDPGTNKTSVVTFKGKVEFGQAGKDGTIRNSVQVGAGQKTEQVAGQAPEPPKPVPPAELKSMNSETKADTASGPEDKGVSTDKKEEKKEETKKEEAKPEEKKADAKQEEKKPDEKKADDKKADVKSEDKKSEGNKQEARADDKKSDGVKPDDKKSETRGASEDKRQDGKNADAGRSGDKRQDARSDSSGSGGGTAGASTGGSTGGTAGGSTGGTTGGTTAAAPAPTGATSPTMGTRTPATSMPAMGTGSMLNSTDLAGGAGFTAPTLPNMPGLSVPVLPVAPLQPALPVCDYCTTQQQNTKANLNITINIQQ